MKSSSRSAMKVLRVMIADDHPVVREGFPPANDGRIPKSKKANLTAKILPL